MKVGDLVRACIHLDDTYVDDWTVPKGTVGVVTKMTRTGQSTLTVVVKFPNTTYMTCFAWQELEVISEGR